MRIVVDTNVIVSALIFGGVPREVIDLAVAGACSFYFSPAIRAEAEDVLQEKFGWSPKETAARTRSLWSIGNEVKPEVSLAVVRDDPDDDRILECALAAEADAIVSGDRHLLLLGSFQSIPVYSPRKFIDSKSWETTT